MNVSYDLYNRTEPTELYIAKPGKRIIGKILGVQEDTAHVDVNFNNANTLEFSMSRNLNGKVNPIYDFVEFHYEIFAKGIGWFKIKEVPQIESNGENEVKSVTAEALEIELQQYDLVDFEINTAQPASQEWNAVDNVYMNEDDIKTFHDGILFYRDTSKLEELADYMTRSGNTSVGTLQTLIGSYPDMFRSWRIDVRSTQAITYAINEAITMRQNAGKEYQGLSDLLEKEAIKKSDLIAIIDHYPEFFGKVLSYSIDDTYTDEDGDLQHYTGLELVELEIQRQKDLSLLDIILKEHGWKVGTVDDYISTDSNAEPEEREYLKNLVGTFEIDSMDIYSFLTQDVAQCFNCVFEFDCDNYLVNALRLEHVGIDTSIALNFHNLQSSITRNSDRPLYTVYHIQGADNIDPTQVNYGLNYIEDISYFLNTDHFSQAFIDKYNNWKDAYESNRAEYCQKSIEYRDQLLVVTEINDRVPNDGCNTSQYRTFSDEELQTEISVYLAQLDGYRALYVDDENNFDLSLLQQHKADYADYRLIDEQIIPNIRKELYNRQVSSVQQQQKFLDGYEFNIAEYGDAYGLQELKTLQTKFKGAVDTMIKREYNVDSDYNDDNPPTPKDKYKHELYEDYVKYNTTLSQINAEIVERQAEYDAAEAVLDQIDARRQQIKALVDKENYFTKEELDLLDKYYIHTDYTNENIVVTDIMTSEDIINQELKLLDAAGEELYADSHPQWSWSTTLDNLLLIPEFKPWYGQLDVGNYVRVTLREDDIQPMFASGTSINVLSSIQEKLRVVRIGFNPFLLDDTIDVDFSTMVRYKSKRNDFAALMDLANASTKNKISSTMASYNRGNTMNVDTTFLMKLLNNSKFNSYLNSSMTNFATSGQLVDALSIGTAMIGRARIDELYVESGLIKKADIGEAHVTSYLDAVQVDAASITAGTLIADRILLRGDNQSVLYQLNTFGREGASQEELAVVSETIPNNTLEGLVLEPNTVNADRIIAHTITANEIHSGTITAQEIASHTITANEIHSDTITANEIASNTITVNEITTNNLVGQNGWINLHQGTFAFGTDKLTWNGSTLGIKGTINSTNGSIGGWNITNDGLSTTSNTTNGMILLDKTGLFTMYNTYATNKRRTMAMSSAGITLGDVNETTWAWNPDIRIRPEGIEMYFTNTSNKVESTVIEPGSFKIKYDSVTVLSMNSQGALYAETIYEHNTLLSNKYAAKSHGNHVPTTQTANNAVFLRNDNTWQTVTPANIGAASATHSHSQYAASDHNHYGTYVEISGNKYAPMTDDLWLARGQYIYSTTPTRSDGASLVGLSSSDNIFVGENDYHFNVYIYGNNIYHNSTSNVISSSDKRIKNSIVNISNAREFVLSLRPRMYRFNNGTSNRKHMGFIADEVEQILPETIGDCGVFAKFPVNAETKVDLNDENTYIKGIRYDELIAPTIAVVQELAAENEQLRQRIDKLEKLLLNVYL